MGTRRSSGAWREEHANAFSQPHALAVLWAQVPMGNAAACFLGVCDRSGCPLSGVARVGGSFASVVAPVAG
jgi:hypothetical protein